MSCYGSYSHASAKTCLKRPTTLLLYYFSKMKASKIHLETTNSNFDFKLVYSFNCWIFNYGYGVLSFENMSVLSFNRHITIYYFVKFIKRSTVFAWILSFIEQFIYDHCFLSKDSSAFHLLSVELSSLS